MQDFRHAAVEFELAAESGARAGVSWSRGERGQGYDGNGIKDDEEDENEVEEGEDDIAFEEEGTPPVLVIVKAGSGSSVATIIDAIDEMNDSRLIGHVSMLSEDDTSKENLNRVTNSSLEAASSWATVSSMSRAVEVVLAQV